jgi:stage V sporulation protein AD
LASANHTHTLKNRPGVLAHAAVVGPKEGEGPFGSCFDEVNQDDMLGQDTFEKGECMFLQKSIRMAIEKAGLNSDQVSFLLAGDLLNQIISASFAARQIKCPFFGLYGACSTMAESLALGALLINAGYGEHAVCATTSHFSTAERQYRTPLEMGVQRPPTAQRTVTGAGATTLSAHAAAVEVARVTVGEVIDMGITDANQMGAAMAPAAAHTLCNHFSETGLTPAYYDLIVTGDLGEIGSQILNELMTKAGYPLNEKLLDCGAEIYRGLENVDAGGSGAACSAVVLNGVLLPKMEQGVYQRILFMATGALLSPTTTMQQESIPCIAHAVSFERRG